MVKCVSCIGGYLLKAHLVLGKINYFWPCIIVTNTLQLAPVEPRLNGYFSPEMYGFHGDGLVCMCICTVRTCKVE